MSCFPVAELSPEFELWLLVAVFPGANHSTTSESPSLFFFFHSALASLLTDIFPKHAKEHH